MRKVDKVYTVAAPGCFKAIATVFQSLPGERELYAALEGDLSGFNAYLEDNSRDPDPHDYNWAPADVTYSFGEETKWDGKKVTYLKEVEFVTPTSGRVIRVEENPDQDKRFSYERFTITIEFGGSETAASQVLAGIKVKSYADEDTRIMWSDGVESSLIDYQLSIYDKLRNRRKSRWSCNQYDAYMSSEHVVGVLTAPPLMNLFQGEYLTYSRNSGSTAMEFIRYSVEKGAYRVFRVDATLYEEAIKLRDRLSVRMEVQRFEDFVHGESVFVFADGKEVEIVYLKD